MYKFIKPVLFKMDPEKVHHATVSLAKLCAKTPFIHLVSAMWQYKSPMLEQNVLGINFPNPVGLAAGFDKNAQLAEFLHAVGFGYAELGSITAQPCKGNPKPRVWRWPKYKSLIIYYGLANDGADVCAERLRKSSPKIPMGASIAKTNVTMSKSDAIDDWQYSFDKVHPYAAFTTINISCPNLCDDQQFDQGNDLRAMLSAIEKTRPAQPVFLKVSPHTDFKQLFKDIEQFDFIKGIVIGNLNKQERHPIHPGGLSGKLVQPYAIHAMKEAYKLNKGRYVLVGCGGIFTAEDAYEYITHGASLVQLITGMIYKGPGLVSEVNKGLVKLLKRDGFKNISEAVGSAV